MRGDHQFQQKEAGGYKKRRGCPLLPSGFQKAETKQHSDSAAAQQTENSESTEQSCGWLRNDDDADVVKNQTVATTHEEL